MIKYVGKFVPDSIVSISQDEMCRKVCAICR